VTRIRDVWKGHTTRRLLVRLLVVEGRAVPRERLREDLWPDAEPEAGRNNLRVAVSRLNDALDPDRPQGVAPHFVVAEGETLALRRESIEDWDVLRFRTLPTVPVPEPVTAALLLGGLFALGRWRRR